MSFIAVELGNHQQNRNFTFSLDKIFEIISYKKKNDNSNKIINRKVDILKAVHMHFPDQISLLANL